MNEDASKLIAERQKTHGNFADTARVTEALKAALMSGPNWRSMRVHQREALAMIVMKAARIVCGDPDHPDHWNDIAGFAMLGAGDDEAGAPREFNDPRLRIAAELDEDRRGTQRYAAELRGRTPVGPQ